MDKTIYFICTGNSCSQMAEGWAKNILGDEWQVYSGGIEARCQSESNRSDEKKSELISQTILLI